MDSSLVTSLIPLPLYRGPETSSQQAHPGPLLATPERLAAIPSIESPLTLFPLPSNPIDQVAPLLRPPSSPSSQQSLDSDDEAERLRTLQDNDPLSSCQLSVINGDQLGLNTDPCVTNCNQPVTDVQPSDQPPDAGVGDGDNDDQVYIIDPQRRTKRFNTYKSRMIRTLNHIGTRTGCYGILYLRR